jgi:hypothetical protein
MTSPTPPPEPELRPEDPAPLLSKLEAAEALGISIRTFDRYAGTLRPEDWLLPVPQTSSEIPMAEKWRKWYRPEDVAAVLAKGLPEQGR